VYRLDTLKQMDEMKDFADEINKIGMSLKQEE
jgi:hypothetical protein